MVDDKGQIISCRTCGKVRHVAKAWSWCVDGKIEWLCNNCAEALQVKLKNVVSDFMKEERKQDDLTELETQQQTDTRSE